MRALTGPVRPATGVSERHGDGQRLRSASGGEEGADDAEEFVEAVVVEPVAGAVDAGDGGVLEVGGAAVGGGVAGAALGAVEQERGAGDAAPEGLDVAAGHVIGRPGADVVVE